MSITMIAVGSKRGPKLNAVKEALDAFWASLSPDTPFELVGIEVDSGVGHTPSSQEELMRGARQRAEALVQLSRENSAPWRYFIGLEGGLNIFHENASPSKTRGQFDLPKTARRRVFLESWAYVSDGAQGYYGRSGGIELPESLAREVLRNGPSLLWQLISSRVL